SLGRTRFLDAYSGAVNMRPATMLRNFIGTRARSARVICFALPQVLIPWLSARPKFSDRPRKPTNPPENPEPPARICIDYFSARFVLPNKYGRTRRLPEAPFPSGP